VVIPLQRSERKWNYDFKMDLKEIECEGVVWIQQAQDKVQWRAIVNTVMNLLVP